MSPVDSNESSRAKLLELLATHAYKKGEFVLASGKKSNFFIDCKEVILRGEGHVLVGHVLFHALQDVAPLDAVAAVAIGGCPLASAVSTVSTMIGAPLDALYIRKAKKDHGTGQQIDGLGVLKGPSKVAVLEDVLTTGGSLRFAVERIIAAGHEVVAAIVLVDRQEGGIVALEDLNIPILSIFRKKDFFENEKK